MSRFRSALDFVKETASEISDDDVPSMAGAIAYFSLLSLPPLLAMMVGLIGVFYGDATAQQALVGQLSDLLGDDGAEQVGTMIQGAQEVGGGSIIGQIVGIAALLFGATGAFMQLQKSLNKAWSVEPDPEASGVKQFAMKRLMSFGMVLTIAFLLAISMVLSTVLRLLAEQLGEIVGEAGWLALQAIDIVLPLAIFTLLFASIFKVLPDAEIRWKDVWVGAAVTAVLFIIGRLVIGIYLGQSEIGEAFGAAGALVVILVWIYFTALLLLVGAEFTQVWARRQGQRIQPSEGAVRVIEDVRREGPSDQADSASESNGSDGEDEAVHPWARRRSASPRAGVDGDS